MTKVTMSNRTITTRPTDDDPGHGGGRAARIATQRPADLLALPRLRGGWREDPDRGLRLVWRFEAA